MDSVKPFLIKLLKHIRLQFLLVIIFYALGYISHAKFGNNNIIEELAETGLQTQGVTVEFSGADSNANN